MNLNFSTVRELVRGAVRFEEKDGALFLRRFTEEQMALYRDRSEDFYKKAHATAGVRLEFVTDSEHLTVTGRAKWASSRTWFGFDVTVDGKPVCHVSGDRADAWVTYTVSAVLGVGKNKRVCVYFPWSAQACVTAVTIDDGAFAEPAQKSRKILCYGDSITQGYDARNPSHSYQNRIADAFCAEAVNKAIGGEVFFPQLAEYGDDFVPDFITVAYGTNDWFKTTREVFEKNAKDFYYKLSQTYPDVRIFALTPIWRGNSEIHISEVGAFSHVQQTLREIADESPNVTLIDTIDFVPHDGKNFSPDVLHPNDMGFSHYAAALIAALKDALQ